MPTSSACDLRPRTLTWTDMSVGIENLVANEIIVPPGGDPVLASWDRPFFYISNPNAYPSTYGPVQFGQHRRRLVGRLRLVDPELPRRHRRLVGHGGIGLFDRRRPDLDAFRHRTIGRRSSFIGGTIAASTPQNIIWAPVGRHPALLHAQRRARPGTRSRSPASPAGAVSTGPIISISRSVTADRVLANTFYLYSRQRASTKPPTAARAGRRFIRTDQLRQAATIRKSCPCRARPATCSITGGIQGSGATPPRRRPDFYHVDRPGQDLDDGRQRSRRLHLRLRRGGARGRAIPAIYIVGYVNNVYGVWQSTNNGPVLDPDRDPADRRTRPDHDDLGRPEHVWPSLRRLRRRRLRLSVGVRVFERRDSAYGHWRYGSAVQRPRDSGQHDHFHRQHERGGDRFGRDADADAQRRRRRDLHGRFGFDNADLHLYGRDNRIPT